MRRNLGAAYRQMDRRQPVRPAPVRHRPAPAASTAMAGVLMPFLVIGLLLAA